VLLFVWEYTTKAGKSTQTILAQFNNGWLDSLDYRTAMAKEMRDRLVVFWAVYKAVFKN
jgi:hypothetical protein